jgi:1,2-phenylacetyl-CoA epoxidase PaaB subunit
MARKPLPQWEIYLARSTPAKYIGTVKAADAEAATKAAANEFNIAEPQANRLIAVRRA